MEDSKIKCKGCPKEFPINTIQNHIQHGSCKGHYSQMEYANLVKLCELHKKRKRVDNYQRKKSQKNIKV